MVRLDKTSITFFASKFFDTKMNSFMHFQDCGICKRFITNVANIFFLAIMSIHVHFVCFMIGQFFKTYLTNKRLKIDSLY